MKLQKAIDTLKQGGVLLYPTDTIWGLGVDPRNPKALEKLFEIKKREKNKSVILLIDSEKRLQEFVDVPGMAWELIDLSEKPLTIVYEKAKGLPNEILAPDGSIGIRLTKDPICQRLIRGIDFPIVSTSANFSGYPSPRQFSDIDNQLLEKVDYVLEEKQSEISLYSGSSIIRIWNDGRIKVLRE